MIPFFFGNSSSPLYGVYHPSEKGQADLGVVLCAPFGQEYMRSHRAMRQLASMLARAGIPVLRFDYYGTGDSAGEISESDTDRWIEDTHVAIEELKDTGNVDTVCVVGLRLGALVASYACLTRKDVEHLVLWDPVISGEAYLEELRNEIKNQISVRRTNFESSDGTLHFNGFAANENFQKSLKELDLLNTYPSSPSNVLQIVSNVNDNMSSLKQSWSSNDGYNFKHIQTSGDWNFVDSNGGILLPQPIIQAIVNQFISREAA